MEQMDSVAPSCRGVLVVDDDERFRERLGRALVKRGFTVWPAPDGPSALELLDSTDPEWAVVDLRMPGMSGLSLVRALTEARPELRVVVLTAYGSIATALEAVRRGAIDYLQKPADIEEIIRAFRPRDRDTPEDDHPLEVPSLARAEWEHINRVLEECGGSIRKASRLLGMHRRTLQRKLAKYPVSR